MGAYSKNWSDEELKKDYAQRKLRNELAGFHLSEGFLKLYRRTLRKRLTDYRKSLVEDDAISLRRLMSKVNESRKAKGLRPLRRIQPRHLKAADIDYWWIDEE